MFRTITIATILITCFLSNVFSQDDIKSYITSHENVITNFDFDNENFQDLDSLGSAIGDKRIVMLGESSHRNGSDFEAKARIIRYLYEKKGFTVIAFESDFFGLNNEPEDLGFSAIPGDSVRRLSIFPMWIMCEACAPLFKYIKAKETTSNPLFVTGFDSQLASVYSQKYLRKTLKRYLDSQNIQFAKTGQYAEFISLCDTIINLKKKDTSDFKKVVDYSNTILDQLAGKGSSFYGRVVKCINRFALQQLAYYQLDNKRWTYHADKIRDQMMADNLKWLLLHKYAEKKLSFGHTICMFLKIRMKASIKI
ncbi:erythromycin esterase family protein [Arachidicoccus terrestris]|uniref:erythromycin esterase family protein n=1 Tax=Arachidicoccus terrestris TaxID=2875539 RepID=UPI001CC7D366|nr:erythromycin esterase family protein [Arachidicoccus terrestris]UAY56422.1 erythromycin esterase family protein [Arachidicoccus terrestris]